MSRPNLWITGLPKAGTSSLFSSLQQHPSITGSFPKETFFLLDRDSLLLNRKNNFWRNGPGDWSQFYDNRNSTVTQYYLEGTTHLFFQKESLEILKKFHAGSRYIIMLREPSERIYSSFVFTRDTLARMPAHITFSQYVSDLFEKNTLDYITHPVSKYVLSNELIYSQYFRFLERWKSSFGKSEIFVGLFEDYVRNNKQFMQNVFHFLELEDHEVMSNHNNPSRAFKYRGFHKALLQAARLIPAGGSLKKIIKKAYVKACSVQLKSTDDDRIAKDRLKEYCDSYNRELTHKFGIDISRWYE